MTFSLIDENFAMLKITHKGINISPGIKKKRFIASVPARLPATDCNCCYSSTLTKERQLLKYGIH